MGNQAITPLYVAQQQKFHNVMNASSASYIAGVETKNDAQMALERLIQLSKQIK